LARTIYKYIDGRYVDGFANRIITSALKQEDCMQNSTIRDYLLVAVLSLLVAVLVSEAFVTFHFLPYRTVVH
jgi:hypothetical protein